MIDNEFKINSVLGKGASSKVFLAQDSLNTKYAIKVIRNDRKFAQKSAMKMLNQEHNLLQQLSDHPNIIKSLSLATNGFVVHDGETENIMYNVLEHAANGALADYIRCCGQIEETLVPFFMLQLCHAVEYVHSKGVAHLDIKLENILMDEYFNVKLADFGSSLYVDSKGLVNKKRGTMVYMAPEVVNHSNSDSYNAFAADVYSLGITLFVLLMGEFPCSVTSQLSTSTMDTYSKAKEATIAVENPVLCERWEYLSQEVRDLINKMTHPDPTKRATIYEVLSHPWMQQGFEQGIRETVYQEMSARKDYIKSLLSY